LIIYGGYQMLERRSYAWALAGGIIAILACSLIAFPVGVWAVVILALEEVRAAFNANAVANRATGSRPGNRGWVLALIVGGGLLLLLLVMCFAVFSFIPRTAAVSGAGGDHSQSRGSSVEWTGQPLSPQELAQANIQQDGDEFRKNFSQTLPLGADGRFSLDNVNGRVEIHGWSSNAVVIQATIHGEYSESVAGMNIHVDSSPDSVEVHTKEPSYSNHASSFWEWLWFHMGDRNEATVDYVIQAPQRAKLDKVSSVNGRIEISGVAGDIEATTVNGRMEIKDAAGNLNLSTVNGHIKAQMASLGGGQEVSLDAVNGQIELILPADADASFSASTVNGSITSDFSGLHPEKEFPVGGKLRGALGHGSANVKATTVNGGFKVIQAGAKN